MKKIYLAVFLACSIGGAVHAQISEGGLPWSMSTQREVFSAQQVSKLTLAEPDYDKLAKEDEEDGKVGGKFYRAATLIAMDADLNNSGTWTYLANGYKVWRLTVGTPGAKAVNFYLDKFNLPEGVKLYVVNKNGKQVLGAFTSANNNKFNNFAIQEVQGNEATLEMNIAPSVNVADIQFHIDKSGAFYRGVELVNEIYGDDGKDALGAKPTDFNDASPCHINANCPQGDGDAFMKAKEATMRILIINGPNAGFCSGTLINNTGNSEGAGNCKPYILLASHCDGENGRSDAHFSQWMFSFRYMYTTCEGTTRATYLERTGASFRSRSKYPSFSPNGAVADFLLLELNNTPPNYTYLAGWNRNSNIHNNEDYNLFIGFHQPAGDAKKLSRSSIIYPDGTFNQTFQSNTHWRTNFTVGGTEGGSSGSGLFDKDGLLIGDLSGGPDGIGSCAPMGTLALYSKLSYTWDNSYDQAEFPGAQSRLKDWLDPVGSGATTLGPTKYNCTDMPTVGINELQSKLDGAVSIYPNPVTSNGQLTAALNLENQTDLYVSFYNVVGAKQADFVLNNVQSGRFSFDLKSFANGVYLMKVTTKDNVSITRRVVIAK